MIPDTTTLNLHVLGGRLASTPFRRRAAAGDASEWQPLLYTRGGREADYANLLVP